MRILWVSNAPFVQSGYGNQTGLFRKLLAQAGHEVATFGVYGHHGPTMNDGFGPILPVSNEAWGNDLLLGHVAQLKPDVVVCLLDIWVMHPDNVSVLTAWAPIDHDPIPPRVKAPLLQARHTWAMSRFAERQMRSVGLTPDYVPHGVDTSAYTPIDRAAARQQWGVDPGRFLAVMVAANRGYPSRKSMDRVLKAWGSFVETHPDALLYLHTQPNTSDGIDLIECAQFYGIPDRNLRFPDLYRLTRGDYGPERMNALYNAADVLLAPSMGEGFGIPVIEAQAAGCPVIVSDFSAQAELASEIAGYKVPVYDDDRFYSLQASEYAMLRPSEIVKALDWAWERRGDPGIRECARAFVRDAGYDAQQVFERWMLPALERQVEREALQNSLQQTRTARRLALRGLESTLFVGKPYVEPHIHQWARIALYIDGKLHAPCNVAGCEAALVEGRTLANGVFRNEAAGIPLLLEDDPTGGVVKIVIRELTESYGLDKLALEPGDVVLDVGAQVGVVSIFLAKRYPGVRVYAFEPVPENFARLERNLKANGVTNVTPINLAVSSNGRELELHVDLQTNSGGSSAFGDGGTVMRVPSTTLAMFKRAFGIGRIKLLKLDCEGAEYEIVEASAEVLPCVDMVRGELHMNAALAAAGKTPEGLLALLRQSVPDVVMHTSGMSL